jgi:hypothetical protein
MHGYKSGLQNIVTSRISAVKGDGCHLHCRAYVCNVYIITICYVLYAHVLSIDRSIAHIHVFCEAQRY